MVVQILVTMLILLVVGLAVGVGPGLWMLFRSKRGGGMINPLNQGPRYRDGGVTYNQVDGIRLNVHVVDPHSVRYRRRHRAKQHKQTKPWMK